MNNHYRQHAVFRLSGLGGAVGRRAAIILLAACATVGAFAPIAGQAIAQVQTDQLGKQLGTPALPGASVPKPNAGKGAERIRARLTLRAGQSIVVRTGASALTQPTPPAPLLFKVGRKPECGDIWETWQGIVLGTKAECAGLALEFDYEVSLVGVPAGPQSAVKVDVRAQVQAGVESCGIADAPFEFIKIPAGSYALKDIPRQLSDLAEVMGMKVATVDAFCMTEEAIPSSEMEAFLAGQTLARKRQSFPEALDTAIQSSAPIELGRDLRVPALAVSHRMARGYAERQSGQLDLRFGLPRLEHYFAAAAYLLRQQPDAPSTHAFLVSLRGGLMEWTDTPCDGVSDAFVIIGTGKQSGLLEKYCYDVSRRVARMGFRLVAPTRPDNGAPPQPVR